MQWLSLSFMKNAFVAVLVIAPLFGLLSTQIVSRRMSFFSDALGHSAFTGIAIGVLCGLGEPMWGACIFAVFFALLFTLVRSKTGMASDTVIGVFSSAAVAMGIFIATFGGKSFTKFNSLLIGDILSVQPSRIALLAVIFALVVVFYVLCYNALLVMTIHQPLAKSRGISVTLLEGLFSALIAVVVTVSMTWVGLLVINSMLVLPAAGARNWAKNTRQYHLISIIGALVCGVLGLYTSYQIGASTGATITLYLTGYFALSFIFRRK